MTRAAELDEERLRWERARLRLVRLDAEGAGSLDAALSRIGRIASRAMNVPRVSVWKLEPATGALHALEVVDTEAEVYGARDRLPVQDLGAYALMLHKRRVVLASDVETDPATRDLAGPYFRPMGISSTIDVPVYRDGLVVGVCCHEHRGSARVWTTEEADFAISVAEVVALELASDELRAVQRALRQHEQAMYESMRDEAIARMARGVAHDVNNLMAVITGAAAVMRRSLAEAGDVRGELEVIEEASRSASRLVHDLLEVGRAVEDVGECGLDDALQDIVPALRASAIARSLAIVPDAPRSVVPVSRARLEQVLLNLVMNARDATDHGGSIEVRTHAIGADRVLIEVQDDGRGIDPEARERIFEPYFSTKHEGQGLGLPTIVGIVRGAGGTIDVQSEPGRGSTVRVELPAHPIATPVPPRPA